MVMDTGFHEVSDTDIPAILHEAGRQGVPVFLLSTAGRTDKNAFFRAVREALPLDPPLGTSRMVWDALSDSLWGGLHALQAPRAVIIWPDAQPVTDAQGDFRIALEILRDIIATLGEAQYSDGRPTHVSVYIAPDPSSEGETPAKG
ncbi:barstar family protein [Streptomyces globisporus]|uniref:barstar family protein n=1 Tax=Streptomyces globisporus TaxID=1908 RepID=UPI0004C55DE2|nr:barstar family protein [Streptomyces globisporus]